MISQLTGVVAHKDTAFAILDVNGVGYKVSMAGAALAELAVGELVTVVTHLVVREDCLDLYGFKSREELNVFELLISVSGIGPKSALGILNVATIDTLRQAVYTEDTTILTRISGIGRKIADKIVIELRGKLDGFEASYPSMKEEVDVLDALRSLGYSEKESQEALKKVPKDAGGTSDKIKHALKHLS